VDRRSLIAPCDADEFRASARARLDACRTRLEEMLGGASGRPEDASARRDADNTLRPLNALFIEIGDLHRAIGLVRNVHAEAALREAAEDCEKAVVKFKTELILDRFLYDAVVACDAAALDGDGRRMLAHLLRDFRRSGVDRDDATRERVRRIHDELIALRQEFARNISTDVRTIELDGVEELEGLPADYIRRHMPAPDGKIRITTDYPDYNPFMVYARSARRREQLYRAFRSRAHPNNIAVLKSILARRYELARLLGYAHWADYVTEDKMIRDARSIEEFIDRVTAAAGERSSREYDVLLERKRCDEPRAEEVFDWEKGYYEELVRVERFNVDSRLLRPFLQYDAVKNGVLALASELFGIEFRYSVDAPRWHDDVEVLDVIEAGRHVGTVYLDMHPRVGKFKHAAMFPLALGVRERCLPEAALVCNFPNPREHDGQALLEHDDVVTFFHEFGHLLHHLFARDHEWVEFAGTGTEWDFVEVPSQLFEEWAWHPEVLERFAFHHESGEVLPADLIDGLREAKDFGQGLQVRQQMYYASLSLRCHDESPSAVDAETLQRDLQNRFSRFRFVEDTHFLASFGHLDGYSALYYTYMWSLVIEKDLFSVFLENGVMDPAVAARYREKILAPGGSSDARDLVTGFLGRPYGFAAFQEWLDAGVA